MGPTGRSRVIRLAEAQAGIPASERSVCVLRRGTLDVVLGTPARPNEQTPHAQDEVYIVIRGRGVLFHDGQRDAFESGDFLFVAAGTDHRFEDFGDDLLVWRVFYGPGGGEVPAAGWNVGWACRPWTPGSRRRWFSWPASGWSSSGRRTGSGAARSRWRGAAGGRGRSSSWSSPGSRFSSRWSGS